MRTLRGLSSRFLSCRCLVGIYQTYKGEVVGVIDVRGKFCDDAQHLAGTVVPLPESAH